MSQFENRVYTLKREIRDEIMNNRYWLIGLVCFADGAIAGGLEDVITDLYGGDGITLSANTLQPEFSHHAHFTAESLERLQELSNSVALVQIPGASVTGVRFEFDPILDQFSTENVTYGGIVGEKPETIGRGGWSLGLNLGYQSYKTLNGEDLDDYKIHLAHLDVGEVGDQSPCIGGPPPNCYAFERDYIELDMDIEIRTQFAGLSAQYGVTENWDVGFSVPIIRTSVDVAATARIVNDASIAFFPGMVHTFDPAEGPVDRKRGKSTGLGDIRLKSKHFFTIPRHWIWPLSLSYRYRVAVKRI